jgi:hypothetical protein
VADSGGVGCGGGDVPQPKLIHASREATIAPDTQAVLRMFFRMVLSPCSINDAEHALEILVDDSSRDRAKTAIRSLLLLRGEHHRENRSNRSRRPAA